MPTHAGLFHLFLIGIGIREIKGNNGLIPRVPLISHRGLGTLERALMAKMRR